MPWLPASRKRATWIIRPVEGEEQSALALLRNVPLFASLSDRELESIEAVAVPRSFPPDTRVFSEGDEGDTCYVVRAGTCRVTREHEDGRAITLATLGRGAIFGELAMFGTGVRSASVEAADDVQLLALTAADVRGLLRRHPELAEKLVVALAERLRDTNERVASQSFQDVEGRVIGVLLQLIPEGEVTGGGAGGAVISLRQADLAQMAGTSRESVSRLLAEMEREGVVEVGRGRLTILDSDALRSKSG